MYRKIKNILCSRKDLSPFLIHLTKDVDNNNAESNLISILNDKKIKSSNNQLGTIKYYAGSNSDDLRKKLTGFVSLSETPIDEIHCLLDIEGRQKDLSEYGIILLKDEIKKENKINPTLYMNTYNDDLREVWENALNDIDKLSKNILEAINNLLDIVGLFESFGTIPNNEKVDFFWEREWRCIGDLSFDFEKNVFLGLCPFQKIDEFEKTWGIYFIDPKMNPRYFSNKIIKRKNELKIKHNIF